MKIFLLFPAVLLISGCFPFPVNMQDEARALGKGGLRLSAGAALNHLELNAVAGVAANTDLYLQAGPEAGSLGVKQTVFDQKGKVAVAVVAGGFLSSTSYDEELAGRDKGKFLGGIVNWYDESRIYSLQLKHSVIDYHAEFNSRGGYDFLWSDRFQQVTQFGASVRWRKPGNRYSFKLGVECYLGNEMLPELAEVENTTSRVAGCVPVLGASFYTSVVSKQE